MSECLLHCKYRTLSLPLWECGLKSYVYGTDRLADHVTPFVGVWIEITQSKYFVASRKVTPFVGVWIEICITSESVIPVSVTPFVGVWIEIFACIVITVSFPVTPFVGVWIEISKSNSFGL